jgi:hypothetical protein
MSHREGRGRPAARFHTERLADLIVLRVIYRKLDQLTLYGDFQIEWQAGCWTA